MAYTKVEYDPHAEHQMRRRRVSAPQVERAVNRPSHTAPSTNPPGRIVADFHTAAGNTLRVVYVERDSGATAYVITVYRMGGTR